MKILHELLQALPPELFNEIRQLTFAAPFHQIIIVDFTYDPPSQLQVNRSTREQYADAFYSSNTFFVDQELAEKWSRSLLRYHATTLNDVRLVGPAIRTPSLTNPNLSRTLHAFLLDSGWCYKSLGLYNVKFQVKGGHDGEWRWMSPEEDAKMKARSKWFHARRYKKSQPGYCEVEDKPCDIKKEYDKDEGLSAER